MADDSNDPLELIMNTRVKGARQVKEAAIAVGEYDLSEDKAAKTAKAAIGVYERLAQAKKLLDNAYNTSPGALPADRFRDIELEYKRRQASVDRLSRPEATRGSMTARAILSSRFGNGKGFMPLVEQGLDAIGGAGTAKGVGQLITGLVDGPLGKFGGMALTVVRAGYELVKAMYEVADASAKITRRFTDLRGEMGGSSRDAANGLLLSRVTGVDGGAGAKAFQDKITTDPLAMGIAGGLGIRNVKSPYGSTSFGPNYQQAIQRVSAIQDPERRRRTAMILGIEQEVNRYSKLSPATRGMLGRDADVTSRLNSPEAERRAAELGAAQERFSQAKDNLTTAIGGAFGENFTPFVNSLATTMNIIADGINILNDKTRDLMPFLSPVVAVSRAASYLQKIGAPTTPFEAIGQGLGLGGSGASGGASASLNANTMALQQNNQHLERLNGIIGGGERAQGGIPKALKGANLNRAITTEGIRLGSL